MSIYTLIKLIKLSKINSEFNLLFSDFYVVLKYYITFYIKIGDININTILKNFLIYNTYKY